MPTPEQPKRKAGQIDRRGRCTDRPVIDGLSKIKAGRIVKFALILIGSLFLLIGIPACGYLDDATYDHNGSLTLFYLALILISLATSVFSFIYLLAAVFDRPAVNPSTSVQAGSTPTAPCAVAPAPSVAVPVQLPTMPNAASQPPTGQPPSPQSEPPVPVGPDGDVVVDGTFRVIAGGLLLLSALTGVIGQTRSFFWQCLAAGAFFSIVHVFMVHNARQKLAMWRQANPDQAPSSPPQPPQLSSPPPLASEGERYPCPQCAELVMRAAKKCRFCDCTLVPPAPVADARGREP
jgi:hypothetical protein